MQQVQMAVKEEGSSTLTSYTAAMLLVKFISEIFATYRVAMSYHTNLLRVLEPRYL